MLDDVSNYEEVYRKAKKFYNSPIYKSKNKNKKYYIINPLNNKKIHFGDIRYEDYTFHKDPIRRARYLNRALNIKGDWIKDLYSPNYLSIILLW